MTPKTSKDATAYVNGRIYTVDCRHPNTEAFIIAPNGTFSNVGTNAAIFLIATQDGLPIYDLKHEFVMPGIHDAHVHLLFSGYALLNDVDVVMETKLRDIISKIHKGCCLCAYTNVYEDWIIANGFSIENFDRSILDVHYPDTPVIIRGHAAHCCYANTVPLKRAGIDPDNEPDVLPSHYVRRKDGTLTGELHKTAVDRMVLAIPFPRTSHAKRSLRHAISVLHQAGVTSVQEAASNTIMLETLGQLDREGALKMDIAAHIVHTPQYIGWETAESLQRLLLEAPRYKTRHVDTNFMKVILDGVPLYSLYSHAELDQDGNANPSKLTIPDIAPVIADFDKRGATCKIHCTGEGSVRTTLDAIEAARQRNPSGPRHEIAHCNGVHADDYPRFNQLDCGAEMSPAFLFKHPASEGNDLLDWDFPKMVRHNAHMTLGSDWIGSPPPSLLEPCAAIFADVDQASNGKGGETLCQMLTLNGAIAVGRDKETGSIEVGKKANFIVVSHDLSRGEFAGAKVLKTWFEGEVVWEVSDTHLSRTPPTILVDE